MAHKPPKYLLRLFKILIKPWSIEDIEGDLNELYGERWEKKGKLRANLGYLADLFTMLNMYKTKLKISNNMKSLFVHHLKSTIRGFRKRKEYFLINCVGLVLALSASILITIHVVQEMSFDNFHDNGNKIVRLAMDDGLFTSSPMGPHLVEIFPEIESNSRVSFPFQPLRFKHDQSLYNVSNLVFVDPGFFEIFSFPLSQGTYTGLLSSNDQIAISEREALKLFGDEEAIGQLITINDSLDVTVRAVFQDVPKNSHLQFDYLLPIEFKRRMGMDRFLDLWARFSTYNYFLLSDENLTETTTSKVDKEIKSLFEEYDSQPEMYLQPLNEIHFNTQYSGDVSNQGDLRMLKNYIAAAFLVFIIACINYVNLSAAIVTKRIKEIGVRKVLGAFKADLLMQYLTEVFLLAFLSFLVSLLLVKLAVPYFNHQLGHDLIMNLWSIDILILLGVYLLAVTFLAGLYPAYLFASLRPIEAIQGKIKTSKKNFRRILVTAQFSFSLVLLILTLVTKSQLQFISGFDPGYDRDEVIVMPLYGHTHNQFKTMKNELLRNSLIKEVSASTSMPINNLTSTASNSLRWEGKEESGEFRININWVEDSYLDLFDIKMKEGRNFTDLEDQAGTYFLINEEAVKQSGMVDPIGKEMEIWGQRGQLIGITENFNFESVHNAVAPMLLIVERQYYEVAFIRYQKGHPLEAIEIIESVAKQVDSNYSSNLSFLDSEFQSMYESEKRTNALLTIFSSLAIIISIMGLFGFITFVLQTRMKEVSIRKVLGATRNDLIGLVSKEFIVMLGVASFISWPIAYILAEEWLADFQFRVDSNWLPFAVSTFVLLIITLTVIGGQLFKVIRNNPTKALRE